MQIGFRRALTVGGATWASLLHRSTSPSSDTCDAGSLVHFLGAPARRACRSSSACSMRLHRRPPPSRRTAHGDATSSSYTSAAIGIALMCVEFRGLASPYLPGVCLVLLSRTVTAQDPWRRGLAMTGIPVIAFFVVLIGAALVSPRIAAQLHDPAALTTLLIGASYVLRDMRVPRRRRPHRLGPSQAGLRGAQPRTLPPEASPRGRGHGRRLGRVPPRPQARRGGEDSAPRAAGALEQRASRASSARSTPPRSSRIPNTVRVFDYGATEDGLWYYVMELLQGETLAEHVMRVGPLSPARAVHIVGQAARALGEAHERGIVHRDVKPENLFLTSLGGEHDFVKVLDFGIAKVASSEGTMTDTGARARNPGVHLSGGRRRPRGGRSIRRLRARRGPVLSALRAPSLRGRDRGRPHLRARARARRLARRACSVARFPPDVEAVVMRALEKDPALRFDDRRGARARALVVLARGHVDLRRRDDRRATEQPPADRPVSWRRMPPMTPPGSRANGRTSASPATRRRSPSI